MKLAVVDPRLLAEVFRDPDGRFAQLFVVLAYGRARLLTELFNAGPEALDALAYRPSQASAGVPLEAIGEEASRVKAALEEGGLPRFTPTSWGLGMTERLFAHLADRVEFLRSRGAWYLDQKLVRSVIELHVADCDPCPEAKPTHDDPFTWKITPSSLEEMVHHTLLLRADCLITADPALLGACRYRGFRTKDGRMVRVASFDHFVEKQLTGLDFSLDDIKRAGDLVVRAVPSGPASR